MEHVDLHPGVVLGDRFLLRKQLGRGSFSAVWLADDRSAGREVALKILHAEVIEDKDTVLRFQREASVLASVEHPGVARAFSLEVEGPLPFIVMEYVTGRELSEELAEQAKKSEYLPRIDELSIIDQIADAAAHAHDLGLLHRDLKPRNVMVDRCPKIRIRILDFGLAKVMFDSPTLATTLGRRLGSILYMSPEQARGGEVDARTDVFALGCIFFEILTLTRAWAFGPDGERLSSAGRADGAHNSPFVVADRIAKADRPRASAFRADLPEAVDEVLARAMAIDQADRTSSARELSSAIRAALVEQRPTISADSDGARWGTRVTAKPWRGERAEGPARAPCGGRVLDTRPLVASIEAPALSSVDLSALPRSLNQRRPPPDGPIASAPILPPPPVPAPRSSRAWTGGALVLVAVAAFAVGSVHGRISTETPLAVRAPTPEAMPAPVPISARSLPIEQPIAAPVSPRADRPKPRPQPVLVVAPIDPPRAQHPLARLLAEAKADPGDLRKISTLRKQILAEAKQIDDERARTSIERRAAAGGALADLASLERCVLEITARER